jgi:hypothetical protein
VNEILETSEIVGTLDLPQGECELNASATAEYNEGSGLVIVRLDASVRRRNDRSQGDSVPVDWLPTGGTVSEFAPIDEASEVARDIFRRWVRKLRTAAPALHTPSFT